MKTRSVALRLAFCLPVAFIAVASAQPPIRIPKPNVPGVKLPSVDALLDKVLKKEAPLTTDIADSFPAIPFLDGYEPYQPMALGELPLMGDETFVKLPGSYYFAAQSYCLKAGTFPPTLNPRQYQGAGYLYAPFKGPKASIITRIFQSSVRHPDVPQHDIQILLWAIIAQTKLSDCPKPIIETARKLLDKKDLQNLDDDILGVLPPEVKKQVLEKAPDDLKSIFEAEDRMRETLTKRASSLTGTVTATTNNVNGRLAQPGEQVSQLYAEMESIAMRTGVMPEIPVKDRIPEGRWSYHADGYFIRLLPRGYSYTLRQVYNPEKFELIREGGAGRITGLKDTQGREVRFTYNGNNVASAAFVALGPDRKPVAPHGMTVKGAANDAERNSAESALAVFNGMKSASGILTADKQRDMNELARLRSQVADDPAAYDLVTRAWMSALARLISGDKVVAYAELPQPETQVASLRPGKIPAVVRVQGFSGGGGGGGGGGAGMGSRGRQRLGQSNRPNKNGPDSTDKAKDGIKAVNKMGKIGKVVSIPLALGTGLANWLCDMGKKIGEALNGDPPRADYKTYATPTPAKLPTLAWGSDVSPARRTAIQNFLNALNDMNAHMQAGADSLDKMGGAKEAKDNTWSGAQGAAYVTFKSSSGEKMLLVAQRAQELADVLEKENLGKTTITGDMVATYQNRIRTQGFNAQELEAARTLGLSAADIEDSKKLSLGDFSDVTGKTYCQVLREAAAELRPFAEQMGVLPRPMSAQIR